MLSEQDLNKLDVRKRMLAVIQAFNARIDPLYDLLLCSTCTANASVQALHPDKAWAPEARESLCSFDCKKILTCGASQVEVGKLEQLIHGIKPSVHDKTQTIYRTVKALLSLFTIGQGQSVEKQQIDHVLTQLDVAASPGEAADSDRRKLVVFTKKMLDTLRQNASLGEDGDNEFSALSGVQKNLRSLIDEWPSEPKQDIESCGLAEVNVREFVQNAEERARSILQRTYHEKEATLKRTLKQVAVLVGDLGEGIEEEKYQNSMKAKVTKMANFEILIENDAGCDERRGFCPGSPEG